MSNTLVEYPALNWRTGLNVRLFLLPIWFFFLVACTDKESGQFGAPEFVSAQVELKGPSALFKCVLTSDRVEQCGILLDENVIEGVLEGSSFTAVANGLEIGKPHSWVAFAKAGGSEIHSEQKNFEVPDGAIPIPDPAFKAYMLQQFDRDADGCISVEEARQIFEIEVRTNGIASVKGIEYCQHLRRLIVDGISWDQKGGLTELDVSGNPELRFLDCINNYILSLDVSHNPVLEHLLCWENQLQELDVSHNPLLTNLSCAQNSFTTLDVTHNPLLTELHFNDTYVAEIDLSANPYLRKISCWNTPLTSLDLSAAPGLENLRCWDVHLSSLDVSGCSRLSYLDCSPCSFLETLFVASGQLIPGVTADRDGEYIPEHTQIVEKSVE